MKKAFVLLSGGLDSTVCLHKALVDFHPEEHIRTVPVEEVIRVCTVVQETRWVEAISIDYGQRHIKEAMYAAATCAKLGIKHTVLDVKGILNSSGTMLTDKTVAIPDISYADIKGVSPTYVPFRNGTLLSIITAHAQKWVNEESKKRDSSMDQAYKAADQRRDHNPHIDEAKKHIAEAGIYFGAHSEDAANWAYPDCTPEFIGAMANAIYIGSYQAIRLYTPLQWLMKDEIVTLGQKLGVDFKDTWSCYAGSELHCGICPTCRSRKDAFKKANVADPTTYAQ